MSTNSTAPVKMRRGVASAVFALSSLGFAGLSSNLRHPAPAAAKDSEDVDICHDLHGWDWVVCEVEDFFGVYEGDGDGGGGQGGQGGGNTGGGGQGNPGGGGNTGGGQDTGGKEQVREYAVVNDEERGHAYWVEIKGGKPDYDHIQDVTPSGSKGGSPKGGRGKRVTIVHVRVPGTTVPRRVAPPGPTTTLPRVTVPTRQASIGR